VTLTRLVSVAQWRFKRAIQKGGSCSCVLLWNSESPRPANEKNTSNRYTDDQTNEHESRPLTIRTSRQEQDGRWHYHCGRRVGQLLLKKSWDLAADCEIGNGRRQRRQYSQLEEGRIRSDFGSQQKGWRRCFNPDRLKVFAAENSANLIGECPLR